STNSAQNGASKGPLSDRCPWRSSGDVAASTNLITQRSLVQIQPPQPPVGKQPPGAPQDAVALCAAADLGPPLAGEGWTRHDHQVSIEVLEDLELGALGISPQQVIQSLQLAHDPRGVHPGRG